MREGKQTDLIEGGKWEDERGCLRFVNAFNFSDVKRFYQIVPKNTLVVRAWQGHKVEHKYFFVAKGSFLIATVEIDNWNSPSPDLTPITYFLNDAKPAILSIPPGYANGIKATSDEAVLIVYSNLTVKESECDRHSFDHSLWLDWSAPHVF